MKKQTAYPAFLLLLFVCSGWLQATDNWPHWRGPSHNGIVVSKTVPTTWSLSQNIKWKTPLPSWSAATPIIWGDRIFVTSPSKAEAKANGWSNKDKPLVYDGCHKFRPVWTSAILGFQRMRNPGGVLAVDESMSSYTGRCPMSQV